MRMNVLPLIAVGVTALSVSACGPVYDGVMRIDTSNDVPGKVFNKVERFAVAKLNIDEFPSCHDARVLDRIHRKVDWSNSKHNYFGSPVARIDRVSERRVEMGDAEMAGVNRRYCRGRAHQVNGGHHTVHYLIEQRAGFASKKWGVEYCVQTHDKHRVYDGSCRTLRR